MRMSEPYHTLPMACLACGEILDAATCVDTDCSDTKPEPGDVTVCLECGHLMMFNEELGLCELTDEMIASVAGDDRIIAIQRARAAVERKKK